MTTLPKIDLEKGDRSVYNLQDFQGKSILIVNVNLAVDKLQEELKIYETLKNKYGDNIVIILVPSMDFDKYEIDIDPEQFTKRHFIFNYWTSITGTSKHDLYKGLTTVMPSNYYEEINGLDILDAKEIKADFTKFFIHHTGVNAFRFDAGHDIDYILDVVNHLMKQDIVGDRKIEVPADYMKALGNIDYIEEPDPWDLDHSTKIKIKDM